MSPQTNRFMEHLIRFLMPFFLDAAPSIEEARAEILETLASYGARTRQEFLLAAQIIAFGLSTLDILADAKAMEMSPSMRLRYRGCANSLNRASQQTEKALAKLLTCDLPGSTEPAPEPLNDISELDLQRSPASGESQARHHPQPPVQPRPEDAIPKRQRDVRCPVRSRPVVPAHGRCETLSGRARSCAQPSRSATHFGPGTSRDFGSTSIST